MNFKGQSALICGAGGGIGLAAANQLITHGLNVAIADLKDQPADLADGPGQVCYFQGDLSNENFVRSIVEQTVAELGGIHYLVNTTACSGLIGMRQWWIWKWMFGIRYLQLT